VAFLGAHTRVTRIRSALSYLLSALQDQFRNRLQRTVYISYCTHRPVVALPISYIAVFNLLLSRARSPHFPQTLPVPAPHRAAARAQWGSRRGARGGGHECVQIHGSLFAGTDRGTSGTDNTLRLELDLIGVLYGIYDVVRCSVIQGDMI
jgi:hypothetical protein